MKRIVSVIIVVLHFLQVAHAHDFVVNGIYYNIIQGTKSVEVTREGNSINSYRGDIEIPSTVTLNETKYDVVRIGNHAFDSSTRLTSVVIPNSIVNIDYSAFDGCTNLTAIVLPNSIKNIGDRAFAFTGLTSINIPESVTSIGDAAFTSTPITSIIISKSVTSIGGNVFLGCHELTSAIIQANITTFSFGFFLKLRKIKIN